MNDATQRFSSRAGNYAKYRPGYPDEVLTLLEERCGLTERAVIADAGSGTGILARMFLENGNRVFGVEPNAEMRRMGEEVLAGYPLFVSVAATAEETKLEDDSLDFVTAGQAFHWFEPGPTRAEFVRILKPDGWIVLVWNGRRSHLSPFLSDYERMLKTYGMDYAEVSYGRKGSAEEMRDFFRPSVVETATFENHQVLDFEGLRGRLLSSSYTPEPGHPNHEPMLAELARIFEEHQRDGRVVFGYDTRVYYGRLS